MFAGAFAASANTPPPTTDPSKTIDTVLKEVFKSQITILDSTLKTATGGEGDYSKLPDQGSNSPILCFSRV